MELTLEDRFGAIQGNDAYLEIENELTGLKEVFNIEGVRDFLNGNAEFTDAAFKLMTPQKDESYKNSTWRVNIAATIIQLFANNQALLIDKTLGDDYQLLQSKVFALKITEQQVGNTMSALIFLFEQNGQDILRKNLTSMHEVIALGQKDMALLLRALYNTHLEQENKVYLTLEKKSVLSNITQFFRKPPNQNNMSDGGQRPADENEFLLFKSEDKKSCCPCFKFGSDDDKI